MSWRITAQAHAEAAAKVREAVAALEAAKTAVNVWTDTVAQVAEERTGATSGPKLWADPEFGAALDRSAVITDLAEALSVEFVAHWRGGESR